MLREEEVVEKEEVEEGEEVVREEVEEEVGEEVVGGEVVEVHHHNQPENLLVQVPVQAGKESHKSA